MKPLLPTVLFLNSQLQSRCQCLHESASETQPGRRHVSLGKVCSSGGGTSGAVSRRWYHVSNLFELSLPEKKKSNWSKTKKCWRAETHGEEAADDQRECQRCLDLPPQASQSSDHLDHSTTWHWGMMGGEEGRNGADGMTVRHGEMTLHLSHVTCVSFVSGFSLSQAVALSLCLKMNLLLRKIIIL